MEVQTYNPSTLESEVAWATQQTQEKKDKEGGESHYLKCQLPFPHSLGCGRA